MLQQKRKGFTLIELLIVVVIIGILAAIAIPKFSSTKEKATVASMRSDLRNLATAQEAYFSDFQAYAPGIAATQASGFAAFQASSGNVVTVVSGDATGWSATVTNPSVQGSPGTCAIAVGDAAAPGTPPANTPEGTPYCY